MSEFVEIADVPMSVDGSWLPDLSEIRCVAFDAVGTLIRPEPSAAEVYYQAARRHGSKLAADEVARRFRAVFRETERGDLDSPQEERLATSERVEFERWRTIVCRVLDDVRDPKACFDELFVHFARPESWCVFEDVPVALEELAELRVPVALASNFDGRLHSVCDGLAVLRGITRRVVSSEIGYRKPSHQFFDALLRTMNCRAQELLMVGDDAENDLEGAQRYGIPAVLINRCGGPENGVLRSLSELAGRIAPLNLKFRCPHPRRTR